jgi:protein gp37
MKSAFQKRKPFFDKPESTAAPASSLSPASRTPALAPALFKEHSMSANTSIEYADSSVNPVMGCNGCELWNKESKACYAGVMTAQYAGKAGWPESFDKPKFFPDRLEKAVSWKDLTGKERDDKPWLDGYPRVVFVNDMSDTFTEDVPPAWLAEALPKMAASPHVWLILTKRARAMHRFSLEHPFPKNVWPGVSVTSRATLKRLEYLYQVRGGGFKWVSVEPILDAVTLPKGIWCRYDNRFEDAVTMDSESPCFKGQTNAMEMIDWVVCGGESGTGARPAEVGFIENIIRQCAYAAKPCFVKQLGSNPMRGMAKLELADPKGSLMVQWPDGFALRQMPFPRQK